MIHDSHRTVWFLQPNDLNMGQFFFLQTNLVLLLLAAMEQRKVLFDERRLTKYLKTQNKSSLADVERFISALYSSKCT